MNRGRDVIRWIGAAVILSAAALAVVGWDQKKQPAATKQQEPQPDFTIRTTSRLVLLDVSVKDSGGGFVSGLTKGNFKVFENGKPQEVTQFANADIPVTVGLVVDESGSMRPKKPQVVAASLAFIQASNPQDEIFVINFNERARRGLPEIVPFTDDLNMLRAALWNGIPEGRTALYDAIEMALHQLDMGRRDKKTLVVISDGGDNISQHKLPDVMHGVLTSAATIYTIGIFDDDDPDKNPGVLERLSRVSGGSAYFPKTLAEVGPICRQIAKDIRTRYTIGYIPTADNGKPERHVKVTASAPDRAKLIVRTRTSYIFAADNERASK